MGIQRSSFYNWKKHLSNPSQQLRNLARNIAIFKEYHIKFPSHGYRWLSAKITLDTGMVFSNPYAHKCCKIAGIKSQSKHYRYKKPGEPKRVYPNLLLLENYNITQSMSRAGTPTDNAAMEAINMVGLKRKFLPTFT